jgi:hypothetical protein
VGGGICLEAVINRALPRNINDTDQAGVAFNIREFFGSNFVQEIGYPDYQEEAGVLERLGHDWPASRPRRFTTGESVHGNSRVGTSEPLCK